MISGRALLEALREYRLIDEEKLDRFEIELPQRDADASILADALLQRGLLTPYQAERLLSGHFAELSVGQHVILEKLGEGGMGEVVKARHRRLERIDALKLIRAECLTDKETVQRFFREAKVVAKLNHPNIIRVYDAAEDEGRHYFVMEFIAGVDLGKVLAQQGPLPISAACHYGRQAALGLQHAHEKGLIHRDVKPANLMLAAEDQVVKVLDLGLAQLRSSLDAGDGAQPLTRQGMIMGTPDFMAPEQAENSTVSIRADIYSLGCSLYQLLTGSVPYPGGSVFEKLSRHHFAPPPPVRQLRPDVPGELAAILEKMMAKKPGERYQEPAEAAAALAPFRGSAASPQSILSAQTLPPRPSSPPVQAEEPTEVHPPVPAAPPSAAGPMKTALMPVDSLHQIGQDDRTIQTRPSPAPPIKGRSRLPVLLAAVVLIAASVAAVVFWPRDNGADPQPRVEIKPKPEVPPDPTKDRKPDPPRDGTKPPPKDDSKVPPPKDNVKPADKSTPPEKPGAGKALGSGPLPEGKGHPGGAGKHEVKKLIRNRSTTLAVLPANAEKAVFSWDGSTALVLSGTKLYHIAAVEDAKPRTIDPFKGKDLERGSFTGAEPIFGSIALSPDGKQTFWVTINTTTDKVRTSDSQTKDYETLVRAEGDRVVRFYGDLWTQMKVTKLLTRSVACSPDGKTILTGTGKTLVRWDASIGSKFYDQPAAVYGHYDAVECVACSPDGKRAVAACIDRKLYLWRLDEDKDQPLAESAQHASIPRCVSFVGPGHVVSGYGNGQVSLWKLSESPAKEPGVPQLPHAEEVLCVAGSAKGDQFASGSKDGRIRIGRIGSKSDIWFEDFAGQAVLALAFKDEKQLLAVTEKRLALVQLTPLPPEGAAREKPGENGKGKD